MKPFKIGWMSQFPKWTKTSMNFKSQ